MIRRKVGFASEHSVRGAVCFLDALILNTLRCTCKTVAIFAGPDSGRCHRNVTISRVVFDIEFYYNTCYEALYFWKKEFVLAMAVLVALGTWRLFAGAGHTGKTTRAEAVPTPMPVQTLEPVVTYGDADDDAVARYERCSR
jgi:hypothetical protein